METYQVLNRLITLEDFIAQLFIILVALRTEREITRLQYSFKK